MMFDVENELSDSQSFTGSSTVSTNSYEKQTAEQDLSIGRKMAVGVFFEATGSGTTHTLEAIQADDAALTSNVEVLASRDVAAGDVNLGEPVAVPFPEGSMDKKYLGFRHSASGGTTTATISAYIMPEEELALTYKSFPKKVNVDV